MFEKTFGSKKTALSVENAPKLQDTDAETFSMLTEKVRKIAHESGMPVEESDLKQAAFRAALAAEREGHPYSKGELAGDDAQLTDALQAALGARIEARPTGGVMHVTDSFGNHLGAASSPAEAQRIVREEREHGEPGQMEA